MILTFLLYGMSCQLPRYLRYMLRIQKRREVLWYMLCAPYKRQKRYREKRNLYSTSTSQTGTSANCLVSRKDFNEYLSKLQRLQLQINRQLLKVTLVTSIKRLPLAPLAMRYKGRISNAASRRSVCQDLLSRQKEDSNKIRITVGGDLIKTNIEVTTRKADVAEPPESKCESFDKLKLLP